MQIPPASHCRERCEAVLDYNPAAKLRPCLEHHPSLETSVHLSTLAGTEFEGFDPGDFCALKPRLDLFGRPEILLPDDPGFTTISCCYNQYAATYS